MTLGKAALFGCIISRRELAAEDCLLVTLPAAGERDPSFLKGNLGRGPSSMNIAVCQYLESVGHYNLPHTLRT